MLAYGDLNNDGIGDIVVTNDDDNYISIVLGNGSGGFYDQGIVVENGGYLDGFSGYAYGVVIKDIDGDGDNDIIIGTNSGARDQSDTIQDYYGVYIFYNDGTPNTLAFCNRQAYNNYGYDGNFFYNPFFVAVADFNNDGAMDIVVTNNADDTGDNAFSYITVLYQGEGFAPVKYDTHNYGTFALVVEDFNNDNLPDIAVGTAHHGERIQIFLNQGPDADSIFLNNPDTVSNILYDRYVNYLTAFDIDGDGFKDLVTATLDGRVMGFMNKGDGTFLDGKKVEDIQQHDINSGYMINSVEFGDFDKDGKLDLVTTSTWNNSVDILRNQVFVQATEYLDESIPLYSLSSGIITAVSLDNISPITAAIADVLTSSAFYGMYMPEQGKAVQELAGQACGYAVDLSETAVLPFYQQMFAVATDLLC